MFACPSAQIDRDPAQDLFDSDQPRVDLFVEEIGDDAYSIMTPFGKEEFDKLWYICGDEIDQKWRNGKGPQSSLSSRDALFIALNMLSHPTTWDNAGADWGISGTTLQKQVHKVRHAHLHYCVFILC